MQKIIFINRYYSPDISATGQLLTDLAQHIAESERNVYVIASRMLYNNPQVILQCEEIIQGVHVKRIRTTRFGRNHLLGRLCDYLSFYLMAFIMLLKITKRGDVLVAKTDPPLICVLSCFVCMLKRARLINWIQDVYPEIAKELDVGLLFKLLFPLLKWLINLSIKKASCNVVISENMSTLIKANGGNNVVIIPNWTVGDISVASKTEQISALRKSWGLNGKFVIGHSGNLGRTHECDVYLETAELLRDNNKFVFLFIGGGKQLAKLQSDVTNRNLKNFVFKPYQPIQNLMVSLSVADVHVVSKLPSMKGLILPSKFYGIINVGKPVIYIGDKQGDIAKIIKRTHCGVNIETANAKELYETLISLTDDDLKRMSNAAFLLSNFELNPKNSLFKWKTNILYCAT